MLLGKLLSRWSHNYIFLPMLFEQAGIQSNDPLAVDRLGWLDKGFDTAAYMDSSLQVEALAG
jgi:hypothetical protein